MKKAFLSVCKKQARSLRSLGLFGGDLRVLDPPLGHCVPRREFHVTSHGVDDFMRFNYALFADVLPFDQKLRNIYWLEL